MRVLCLPWVVALTAIHAAPSLALAQERAGVELGADADRVRAHFMGREPGLRYEIYFADAEPGLDQPLETCAGSCSIDLRPGVYRLRLQSTATVSGGEKEFEIWESSQVLVGPRSSTAAFVGLGFGIAGIVAGIAGSALMATAALSANCHNGDKCGDHGTELAVGVLLVGAAAVTIPVGWSAFARNIRPRAEVKPLGRYQTGSRTVRLKPILAADEVGLSVGMSF